MNRKQFEYVHNELYARYCINTHAAHEALNKQSCVFINRMDTQLLNCVILFNQKSIRLLQLSKKRAMKVIRKLNLSTDYVDAISVGDTDG